MLVLQPYRFAHAAGVHEECSAGHQRRHRQLVAEWERHPERQRVWRNSRHVSVACRLGCWKLLRRHFFRCSKSAASLEITRLVSSECSCSESVAACNVFVGLRSAKLLSSFITGCPWQPVTSPSSSYVKTPHHGDRHF